MTIKTILKSRWLYALLAILYLLSPKMVTLTVWHDYIKPEMRGAHRLIRINSARFLDNGDLEACVVFGDQGNEPRDSYLVLPLRSATDPSSEIVRDRTTRIQRNRDDFKIAIDESMLGQDCSVVHDPSIYLNSSDNDEYWLDHDEPILDGYEHELLIGSMEGESSAGVVFLTRPVLRRVRLVAMGGEAGRVEG